MRLPIAVPEIPVADVQAASSAWMERMGFSLDWTYQDSLAGISRDDARIFLRRRTPRETEQGCTVTVWLNMRSPAEVDQLHAEWSARGVTIAQELRTAPYNLREFTAQDLDGNHVRVFHDLGTRGQ